MKTKLKNYLWLILGGVFLALCAIGLILYFTLRVNTSLEGSGTETDPYLVQTKDDLYIFNKIVNESADGEAGKYYKIISDIDLHGAEWTPIAAGNSQFNGTFLGNGKTVSNFTIKADYRYVGFFANIGGGENSGVYDLNLKNVEVNSLKDIECFGVIAGYATAAIDGCTVEADINLKGNTVYVGGIAGTSRNVKNCVADGVMNVETGECVNNNDFAWPTYAGIVGNSYGDIENCVNNLAINITKKDADGNVDRQIHSGGICGSFAGNICKNLVNNADIKAVGALGGIIGIFSNPETVVENCFNYGKLSSQSNILCDIGGVVARGYTYGNVLPEIKNCYNSGDIELKSSLKMTGDSAKVIVCWAGGILGVGNVNVSACAAKCNLNVSGEGIHYAGGVSGGVTGTLKDSYHIGNIEVDTKGSVIAGGVVGVVQDISYYQGDKSTVKIAVSNTYNVGEVNIRVGKSDYIAVANYLVGGVIGYNMKEENTVKNNYFDSTVRENADVPEGFLSYVYWYGEETAGEAENVNSESIIGNSPLTTAQFKASLPDGFVNTVWTVEGGGYPMLYWENAN